MEAFKSFIALPANREKAWEFIGTQCEPMWTHEQHSFEHCMRQLLRSYPSVIQVCIVKERTGQEREMQFVCEEFPELKFPRRDFVHLYRETRNNIEEIANFWIRCHEGHMRDHLQEQKKKGKKL